MNYEVSGEFDQRLAMRHAAYRVLRTYAIYACLGVVFLIFLWFKGAFESAHFSLRGLLMAMGSAFGLLQIIVFLGYGLVNVPRQLHYMNSFDKQVNIALCRVDTCEDRLQSARLTIEDYYQVVLTLKAKAVGSDPDLKCYIDILLAKFPSEIKHSDGLQAYKSLTDISEE